MLTQWISSFFSNLVLIAFIAAIVTAAIDWPIQKVRTGATAQETFFRWVALLPLGVIGIYTAILHAFFPDFTAASIGWASSPFQFEVAAADLGIGLLGIFAFRASYGFRLATVIVSTCFLWGCAIGHIFQMVFRNNFSIGNAGSWFWMDIIIPLVLILCIIKLRPAVRI